MTSPISHLLGHPTRGASLAAAAWSTSRPAHAQVWLLICAALLSGLAGCAEDIPVVGPKCGGDIYPACTDVVDQTDTQIGNDADTGSGTDTIVAPPVVKFYVETASGNTLENGTSSAKIGLPADTDKLTKGVQVNVVVRPEQTVEGAQVTLTVGTAPALSKTVVGGEAKFDNVTIGCGATGTALLVSVTSQGQTAQLTKTLEVDCGATCEAEIVAVAEPCLTIDGDSGTPGFQYTFTVKTATPDCTDAHLEFIDAEGQTVKTPNQKLAGASSVPIKATLSSKDAGLEDAKITVVAVVEDLDHDRGSTPSPAVTVNVTTESPAISIVAPLAKQVTLTDDLDPATPGIQLLLKGTATSMSLTDPISITVDGGAPVQTTLQVDGTFQTVLTLDATKVYGILVTGTNACGLSGTANLVLNAFATQANLSIATPAMGAVLLAKDDLVVPTPKVYDTEFTVNIQDGVVDSEVSVFCRKAALGVPWPATPAGKATVTGPGPLTVPVAIDWQLTGSDVACYATDGYGDFAALNPSLSDEVTLTVALPAPCLTVTSPAAAESIVTSHTLSVVLSSLNQLKGKAISVTMTSDQGVVTGPQPVGTMTNIGLATKVALAADGNLPDGTYVLTFEGVDAFGNKATDSAAAGLCGDVTRTIHLDTTGPVIGFSLPNKATLTTFDDPDSAPTQPGYQADVALDIADAVVVCLSTSAGEKPCKTVKPTDTTVSFASVTLQPGVNVLNATAKDDAGNETAAAPLVTTLVSDSPIVQFTSPAGNLTVVQDTLSFTASVTQVGGAPVVGAVTEVLVDGQPAAATVSETSPGIYAFDVSGLSSKASTTVQLGAAAPGAEDKKGYSVELTITYKASKPVLQLTAPTNAQVMNIASPSCFVGSQNCQTTVTASVTDAEVGSEAKLQVTCGTSVANYAAKVSAQGLSFAEVVLVDQKTCSLQASVIDLAGQVGLADPVTVLVDRVAPKFGQITQPNLKQTDAPVVFVAGEDVNADPSDGVQTYLQILVAGVPAGAKATLTVIDDSGAAAAPVEVTVPKGTPDNATISLPFGLVSLPSGDNVHLIFSVADAAGNSTTLDVTADVTAAKPEVQIGEPLNVQEETVCSTSASCGGNICLNGKCVAFWNLNSIRKVTVSVAGLPNSGKVSLCTNAAGTVGAACSVAGFKEVASSTATSTLLTFVLPSSLKDGTYVFIAEASAPPLVPVTTSLKAQALFAQKRTVLIDTVAPTVTTFTAPAAPGTTAACLNAASESKNDGGLAGGSFGFSVAASEPSNVTIQGNGAKLASAAATGIASTVVAAVTAEGPQVFSATAVDAVGNVGTPNVLSSLLIDTKSPTGGFASPSAAKVILGNNLNVVVTSQSTDVEGTSVLVKDGGVSKGSENMTGGQATFTDAKYQLLSQGDHTLTADVTDVCGNVGVLGTAPSKVMVDVLPPTLSFSAPAQGASFGDADDAAAAQGGYQVQVAFATSDATTWKVELANGCDAAFANCTGGFKQIAVGSVTNPGSDEPAILTTIPFGNGDNYAVRLTGTDVNGNKASIERGFKVQLSGCLVSLTGLSNTGVYNTQSCATPGQDCASVAVKVTAGFVGPCGTVANLQLKKGGAEVDKQLPSPEAKASLSLTVADADNTTVEAVALDATGKEVGTTGALSLKADLTNPKATFVAGSVLGVPTLAGGTLNLVGKGKDLNGLAGHQLHLQVEASDSGLAGGSLTKLTRTVASSTVNLVVSSPSLPVVFAGNSQTLDIQYATLGEDVTNTVTATVTDAAGNVGTGQIAVRVDWTPPAKPTLADFGAADLNPRRPLAKLNFAAPGDNGSTGTADSYLVRYSKKTIVSQADFDAACDASKLPFATIGKPQAAGLAESLFVEGPDERDLSDPCKFTPLIDSGVSAWHFAIQAVDAAGNASAISNVVKTTELRLHYANIVTGGALKTTDMQQRIAQVGDLNGDGLGDFALGGGTSSSLCIVYGRVNLNLSSIDLSVASAYPSHVCLTNPGGLGAPVGRSGDVNGDGVADLVVGVGSGTGNPRFVHVYLGAKNAAIGTTPAVIIKNVTSTGADGVWKASAIGNFSGTKSTAGKPLADIAVTCRSGILPYDRVMVIPGSETLSASTPRTIDIDSPTDRAKYNVGTIRVVDSTGAPGFGSSLLNVGNMLVDSGATQYDDLAICQGTVYQAVWIIKGRALVGDVDIGVSKSATTGPEDKNAVQIQASGSVAISLFGLHMDVINLDNDPLPDLVIQHASSTAVGGGGLYWLHGSVLAGNLGKIVSMTAETLVPGTSNLFAVQGGYRLRDYHFAPQSVGNFADRPVGANKILDVVHGRPTYATDGANNRVVVRLGFARPSSPIPGEHSFVYSDVAIYDPANNAATGWGITAVGASGPVSFAPISDFNGDGVSDLVIGSSAGSLIIVY